MAKANLRIMVERSQHRRSLVGKLNAIVDGLAATANAAARSSHDLNEVIVHSAALQRIEQLTGICQAMGYRYAELAAVEVEDGLAPAITTADLLKGIGGGILPPPRGSTPNAAPPP